MPVYGPLAVESPDGVARQGICVQAAVERPQRIRLFGRRFSVVSPSGLREQISKLVGSSFAPRVISHSPEDLKQKTCVASNSFSTGLKPTFRLTTQLGRTITITSNQKLLGFDRWVRLDEIVPGETLIGVPRIVRTEGRRTISGEELILLGHLIGNGCTLPTHVCQYTTPHRELADLVKSTATAFFGDKIKPRISHERNWLQVYLPASFRLTHGRHSPIRDWLEPMSVWGLRSPQKKIPECLFIQPEKSVALFLSHLWSTDGCISFETGVPVNYYSTSSVALAMGVQSALLRIGINARVSPVPQTKGLINYHVTISGKPDMAQFFSRIGAVSEKHKRGADSIMRHLDQLDHNTNRDIIPASAWAQARSSMSSNNISCRALAAAMGTAYNGAVYTQNMGRERAARVALASGCEQLRRLSESDIYWDMVASVEPAGIQETFDLTVPDYQNYIANDIYVHNSLEQDADVVAFVFRPEVYDRSREDLRGHAELIIAKQREGPTGIVNLTFLHSQTRFENRAEDLGEEERQ